MPGLAKMVKRFTQGRTGASNPKSPKTMNRGVGVEVGSHNLGSISQPTRRKFGKDTAKGKYGKIRR